MIFHFSIYRCDSNEAIQAELADVETARSEACRLLDHYTRGAVHEITNGQQARVVVSDDQGLDLFTLAYLASSGGARHDLSRRPGQPLPVIIDDPVEGLAAVRGSFRTAVRETSSAAVYSPSARSSADSGPSSA